MTNDSYLIVSYFICAALAGVLSIFVYLFLRKAFAECSDSAFGKGVRPMLSRLFPLGLVFPALLGFTSVSYQGCNRKTYEAIVESRGYLLEKNQEQISSTLLYLAGAVVFWDAVLLLILRPPKAGSSPAIRR